MSRTPLACRREAYQTFAESLDVLESSAGLLRAAVAIAMHDMPEANVDETAALLGELTERVRARVTHPQPQALLAHLHALLFEEEQFCGNLDDYYAPANSYLPAVMRTRRGIPISLVLVYKLVAEPLGFTVEGINAPGHFLARIHAGDEVLLVDPFFHGQTLSEEEAWERISQVVGSSVVPSDSLTQSATHAAWLARMLNNLQRVFAERGEQANVAAMVELQALLER